MSARFQPQTKTTSMPAISFTPAREGLLQRKRLASQPPLAQARLTIGRSGDRFGQEADQVAETMMRLKPLPLQRQVESEQEEEEREQFTQAKTAGGRTSETGADLEAQIHALRGRGSPMPRHLRRFAEQRFRYDFSRVRIHTDARAADAARAVNAQAFTLGRDIVFGGARYAPEKSTGRRLLFHELAHVVQQGEGRHAPTIQRVCSPPQTRESSDPNEGQKPGAYQFPDDPCTWVLYGFHIGSSEFMFNFTPAVNQLTQYLEKNPTARISLRGHSDCFGSDTVNAELAVARSRNVQNAFSSGVHSRIEREPSDGKTYLVANDTALRRAINRSVRIVVTPPDGGSCPTKVSLEKQLSPVIARGECGSDESELLLATKAAVPIAITALARVRNWRDSETTKTLLDLYYDTTNDTEREEAAKRVIGNLQAILTPLRKPIIDCALPGKTPKYKALCPSDTIADAGGSSGILIPTFCFPQFMTILTSTEARAITVIHEFSHRFNATADYGAYYTTNTCEPTTSTVGLSRELRLSHTDTFACFVGMTALQPPK